MSRAQPDPFDNAIYDYVAPERESKAPPVSVRFTHNALARLNVLVHDNPRPDGSIIPRANWIERIVMEELDRRGIPCSEGDIEACLNRIRYRTSAALDRRKVPRGEDILAREKAKMRVANAS